MNWRYLEYNSYLFIRARKIIMKIYYQWFPWAYSHEVSLKISKELDIKKENIIWVKNFKSVFDEIKKSWIWVLPIENSYAWSIHENFYHLISWSYEIFWEVYLDINHFLLSNTKNIKDIKKVYSHPQALAQCNNFLNNYWFDLVSYWDTSGAAKYVSESKDKTIASVSSKICASIYNLNILEEHIQDQKWNTTRFFVVVSKDFYKKNKEKLKLKKNWKVSISFRTKDTPAALYKCLWAFATRFINLSKIESLPSHKNRFEYIFWIDFEILQDNKIIKDALEELKFFSNDLKILWEY